MVNFARFLQNWSSFSRQVIKVQRTNNFVCRAPHIGKLTSGLHFSNDTAIFAKEDLLSTSNIIGVFLKVYLRTTLSFYIFKLSNIAFGESYLVFNSIFCVQFASCRKNLLQTSTVIAQ